MHDDATLLLTDAERRTANRLLTTFLDGYERSVDTAPIVPDLDRGALAKLLDTPFPERGRGVEEWFATLHDTILPNSTTVAHPRFLAYVLGPPNGIAAHAEAVAATINQNCNFWQLSPAASVVERAVVGWLAGLFDYPAQHGGILTGGGSIATMNALTVALHERRPDFRARGLQAGGPPLVLYTSTEAHRCVDKAAALLGIGLDNVRHVPTDGRLRMRPDALRELVRADRAAGREPFCVVATAGTVTTGAIDPVDAIADVCGRERLWLHVDGAYGGLFALTEQLRPALRACARADSIALDPHKLLFAPLEAGCLLVRDAARMRDAFAFSSSYLTVEDDALMTDFMDLGPQLSRGFKALKVWSALQTFGVAAFRDSMRRMLDLAARLARRVEAAPELELLAPATLTAVCLRIPGAGAAGHRAVLTGLAQEGTALLGPATVRGAHAVRACVTNHRTTAADIDLVADRLIALARDPSIRCAEHR